MQNFKDFTSVTNWLQKTHLKNAELVTEAVAVNPRLSRGIRSKNNPR